jgi:hypothetical protein
MSKLVILPTFDLVTESLVYDDLFRLFLRGGVRSVVKGAVLNTSFQERAPAPRTVDFKDCQLVLHHHSALVDFVLKRFDDYTTRRHSQIDESTGLITRKADLDMSEYLSRIGELELITQTIEETVLEMMEDLFRTRLYHIDEMETRWQDRDLIIGVETLTSQWGRRRAL